MGNLSAIDVLDRLSSFGCKVRVEGDKLKIRGPDRPEVEELVSELRGKREAAIAFLQDQESRAPSLEEIKATLPPGVEVASYKPKDTPFAVAPVSVVTNAATFFRAYLRDLAWRMEHPRSYAAAPLPEILAKLADAGLELRIQPPGVPNVHGVVTTDEDIPF